MDLRTTDKESWEGDRLDLRDTAELETPVGIYGSMKQVAVAGDPIFGLIIGVVVQRGHA